MSKALLVITGEPKTYKRMIWDLFWKPDSIYLQSERTISVYLFRNVIGKMDLCNEMPFPPSRDSIPSPGT